MHRGLGSRFRGNDKEGVGASACWYYPILSAGETAIGGLMGIPPEAHAAGARPVWNGYIAVDDVDAVAARVKQEGGGIHHAPRTFPASAGSPPP